MPLIHLSSKNSALVSYRARKTTSLARLFFKLPFNPNEDQLDLKRKQLLLWAGNGRVLFLVLNNNCHNIARADQTVHSGSSKSSKPLHLHNNLFWTSEWVEIAPRNASVPCIASGFYVYVWVSWLD